MAVTYYRTQHNVIIAFGVGLAVGLAAHVGLFPWAVCWVLFYFVAAWLVLIEVIVFVAKEDE